MIGVGAVGAGVDCMVKLRDRRNRLAPWEVVLTLFIGTSIGSLFGYIAKLAGAPDYVYIGTASMAGYLNTRLVEFIWSQFRKTVKSKLGNDQS